MGYRRHFSAEELRYDPKLRSFTGRERPPIYIPSAAAALPPESRISAPPWCACWPRTAPERASDVVLGFDTAGDYRKHGGCLGAVASAGMPTGSAGPLSFRRAGGFTPNEGPNNLHSGPDYWFHRMWQVDRYTPGSITLSLETPDGDQAFPAGDGWRCDPYAAGKPPADSLPGAL